jgi:choline dehydrogenase
MKRHILSAFLAASYSLVQAHPKSRNVPGNDFGISGDNATFDYVVVGGGTAGLALA